jgi:hypothetical protein
MSNSPQVDRDCFSGQAMSASSPPDSLPAPEPERNRKRVRKRIRASDEAVMTLTRHIANWQARLGWNCAMWGLIPVAGLPLGVGALVLGLLGYRRVRRSPEDLGIRHAVGALIMGPIEIAVNVAGLACIARGIIELWQ